MSVADEIRKLAELREAGHITQEEYDRAKARLLAAERPDAPVFGALRRSTRDRWLGGVCGGLAKFTGAESWIWRLLFTLAVFFGGIGLIPYILLWIFVPLDEAP